MKGQLILGMLLLALCARAQQLGFSHFSSNSEVHKKEDGKTFIYALGEPINTYKEGPNGTLAQGLMNSEKTDFTDFDLTLVQIRAFNDLNVNGIKDIDETYVTIGSVQLEGEELQKIISTDGVNYLLTPGTYNFNYFKLNSGYEYTSPQEREISVDSTSCLLYTSPSPRDS